MAIQLNKGWRKLKLWLIIVYIGSEMNFHFIRYLWNELRAFISPSLWRGDIKRATSFINTVWNENSFQILFITCSICKNVSKIHIYRVFLPILLRKTRQRRCVTYDVIDELRRLSLSKSSLALCHKLIYEIAIFHSINGERCDKILYYLLYSYSRMTPHSVHSAASPALGREEGTSRGFQPYRSGEDLRHQLPPSAFGLDPATAAAYSYPAFLPPHAFSHPAFRLVFTVFQLGQNRRALRPSCPLWRPSCPP